jgi:hypothetical protein
MTQTTQQDQQGAGALPAQPLPERVQGPRLYWQQFAALTRRNLIIRWGLSACLGGWVAGWGTAR